MTTETRTKEVEYNVFITSDGQEFEFEDEAVDYEITLFLDKVNMEDMSVSMNFDSATYYIINSESEFQALSRYMYNKNRGFNYDFEYDEIKYPVLLKHDHDINGYVEHLYYDSSIDEYEGVVQLLNKIK